MNKTPLVFFGASHFLIPTLEMLCKHYDVKLVITTEYKDTDAIPQFCKINNIPFLSVSSLKNDTIVEQLKTLDAPLAIVSYFGLIIPQSIIDLFPKGMVNIHPSLLPEYRGATPGTSALLDGKTETGVSIMLIDADMDHGPVLAQEKEVILPDDTAETLYTRLFALGNRLLEKTLPLYLEGKIMPQEQDHSKATFCKGHLTREDGFIDMQNPPTYEILDRKIRALFPWPGAWTKMTFGGKEKVVKLLPEHQLQVEGKKPMSVKDFLNGYPDKKEDLEKLGLL